MRIFIPIVLIILLLLTDYAYSDELSFKLPDNELVGGDIPKSVMNADFLNGYFISYDDYSSNGEGIPWNVKKINADKFWNLSKGEGIKVAILDTGINYTHPDLVNSVNGGISFVGEDPNNYTDYFGHGTAIAGIIAAQENGFGIVGIAPEVQLYSVKVLNDTGYGTLFDIVDGLEWCLDNGMDIVVMSFGSNDNSFYLEWEVDRLYYNGIILVAAAGNNRTSDDVNYPARYENVIAVSSTDKNDVIAYTSSRGPSVELSAPGDRVYTTTLNGGYSDYFSGTSFSAPHVAGAAALLLSHNNSYTSNEIKQILRNTSVDLGGKGRDDLYGYGRVDAGNTYDFLTSQTPTTTTTTTSTTSTTTTTS
ncbi:MAG: hypothetical protein CO092_00825, partial [Candidatus Aenigmarchaeota archaeon CG_4_9_14_3_um_filter_37_18]